MKKVNGVRRNKSDMLREQCKEKYVRALETKIVKWNEASDIEHMWEQVKEVMVDSAREMCVTARMGRNNPRSEWWNYQLKVGVKGKKLHK